MRRQGVLAGLALLSGLFGAGPSGVATASQESRPAMSAEEIITLKIDGWTCASCEKDVRRELEAVPGVRRAEMSYARGGAVVEVEPGRVTEEQLMQAVARAGNILSSYRATVVPNGSLMAEPGEEGGIGNWFRSLFH